MEAEIYTTDKWMYKPKDMFSVKDKITFVTGAASGIGQAIALAFDALGARVILADISEEGLEQTASACKGDILKIVMDVTRLDSVQQAVKETVSKYGGIDVSFNIPGINIRKPVFELGYEEFDRIMQINLYGVFRCAKEVGKVMYDQKKGAMINLASVFSEIIQSKAVAYAASKGAVRQMTRVMASEWAPYVRVNAIGPGYVETPLVKQVMEDRQWYDNARKHNMFQRFGKPEEIVGPAIFLASDASSLMTGSLLLVDAGWHCFGGQI